MTAKGMALLFGLIALLLTGIVPTPNAPPPDTTIAIEIINAPKEAVFIDLLMNREYERNDRSEPNQAVLDRYPGLANSELIQYDSDGYVSYSLYYAQQETNMSLNPGGEMKFAGGYELDDIKIAILDQYGGILQISDTISLRPTDNLHTTASRIQYDYQANTAQIRFVFDAGDYRFRFNVLALVIFAVIRMIFSTGIEVALAFPFKIKPIGAILLVNLLTQIMITIGIPVLTVTVSYPVAVVASEILIYGLEFLAYLKFTRKPKWKRVLLYTVTANTVSLLIGLGLNAAGLFWA